MSPRPLPPATAEETELRLRTMGYRVNEIGIEKLSLQVLYSPPGPKERDSGEGTMGVGLTTSMSTISTPPAKNLALGPPPPLIEEPSTLILTQQLADHFRASIGHSG